MALAVPVTGGWTEAGILPPTRVWDRIPFATPLRRSWGGIIPFLRGRLVVGAVGRRCLKTPLSVVPAAFWTRLIPLLLSRYRRRARAFM